MRLKLVPPPSSEEMLRRTPHELVRDFPETLSVFRDHDLPFSVEGARRLEHLDREPDGNALRSLLRDLEQVVGWRREG